MPETMSYDEFMAKRPKKSPLGIGRRQLLATLTPGGDAVKIPGKGSPKYLQATVSSLAVQMGFHVSTSIIDGEVWAVRPRED